RISRSRHKTSRAATKNKKNDSKRIRLRPRTSPKRNSSSNLVKVHLLRQARKSSRKIRVRRRRENSKVSNHPVPVKEKMRNHRHRPEKAKTKMRRLRQRIRRRKNSRAK